MLSQQEVGMAQVKWVVERIKGIEAHRLLDESNGFLWLARPVQNVPQLRMVFSIVGIEGDGPPSLGDGLLVVPSC